MNMKKTDLPFAYPINYVTGKEYTECNDARLLQTEMHYQRLATFKQWKSVGYKVKKGSKGTMLIKIVSVVNKRYKNGEKKQVPNRFYVFNITQVEEIK